MLVSKVLFSKEGSTLGDTQQFGEDDIIIFRFRFRV
jgi:hypothetical protein